MSAMADYRGRHASQLGREALGTNGYAATESSRSNSSRSAERNADPALTSAIICTESR